MTFQTTRSEPASAAEGDVRALDVFDGAMIPEDDFGIVDMFDVGTLPESDAGTIPEEVFDTAPQDMFNRFTGVSAPVSAAATATATAAATIQGMAPWYVGGIYQGVSSRPATAPMQYFTAGVHTAGAYATGVHTSGAYATGVHTTGVHTTGVHTTGVQLIKFKRYRINTRPSTR